MNWWPRPRRRQRIELSTTCRRRIAIQQQPFASGCGAPIRTPAACSSTTHRLHYTDHSHLHTNMKVAALPGRLQGRCTAPQPTVASSPGRVAMSLLGQSLRMLSNLPMIRQDPSLFIRHHGNQLVSPATVAHWAYPAPPTFCSTMNCYRRTRPSKADRLRPPQTPRRRKGTHRRQPHGLQD